MVWVALPKARLIKFSLLIWDSCVFLFKDVFSFYCGDTRLDSVTFMFRATLTWPRSYLFFLGFWNLFLLIVSDWFCAQSCISCARLRPAIGSSRTLQRWKIPISSPKIQPEVRAISSALRWIFTGVRLIIASV
jgi:hypothetical protein